MDIKSKGGVSIFIVMFTALIVTVITVSFTQIMIRNSQQAFDNDLSQRAYDSAIAGVEDAKRLLVMYRDCTVRKHSDPAVDCSRYQNAIYNQKCSTIQDAGLITATGDHEVPVGETDTTPAPESKLVSKDNQYYTCVKINMEASEIVGSVPASGKSITAHLKGKSRFSVVNLTWFTSEDLPDTTPPAAAVGSTKCPGGSTAISTCTTSSLFKAGTWKNPANNIVPPMLRVQYVPASASGDTLDSQTATRFFYPSGSTDASGGKVGAGGAIVPDSADMTIESRATRYTTAYPALQKVRCTSMPSNVGMCRVALYVNEIDEAYIIIRSIYGATHFTVSIDDNTGSPVNFDGIQPHVDSTGRADNLFRRIDAAVELRPVALPYPEAAVDVSGGNPATAGDFCKAFFITNDWVNEDTACSSSPSSAQ